MSAKDAVLSMLFDGDEAMSVETLAERLNFKTERVTEAIEQLRAEGHGIEQTQDDGFFLSEERAAITIEGIRRYLTQRELGGEIELHECIDSTNTRAKVLAAQGAVHGTLVCARTQTSGRGRLGRSFHSPEGTGVYMSFILRPQLPAEQAMLITSMTAVAVARAIERLVQTEVQIKWVNDLYIAGKKVCGILCEAGIDFQAGRLNYAVVGIGVNTAKMDFPEEIAQIATSIGNACGREISKARLIAEICACMEEEYANLAEGTFMEESRRRSNVIGRKIRVLRGEENFPALALDIDDQGGLVIETENGVQTVRSGEISVRWEKEE